MKIKITILDDDTLYLNKLIHEMTEKHADNFEISCFNDYALAMDSLRRNRSNVFIVSDIFDVDSSMVPQSCVMAYWVSSREIANFKGCKTIFKYQMFEDICRDITNLYADNVPDDIHISMGNRDGRAKVIAFTSPTGGVGVTSTAIAFAKAIAVKRKKVFYLNLGAYDNTDLYLSADGSGKFDDVLYLVERNDPNIALKLNTAIKRDESGIAYFSASTNAIDVIELDYNKLSKIIDALNGADSFEYIIIDFPFRLDYAIENLFNCSDRVLMLSDGTPVSNTKLARAYSAIDIFQQQKNIEMESKIAIIYNRFRNRTGAVIDDNRLTILGGIPKIENGDYKQIIDSMAGVDLFTNIMNRMEEEIYGNI